MPTLGWAGGGAGARVVGVVSSLFFAAPAAIVSDAPRSQSLKSKFLATSLSFSSPSSSIDSSPSLFGFEDGARMRNPLLRHKTDTINYVEVWREPTWVVYHGDCHSQKHLKSRKMIS